MQCKSCGGVAHPATGCQYSDTYIICGVCTRKFWTWVKGHTDRVYRAGGRGERPKRFVSFYASVTAVEQREQERQYHLGRMRVVTAEVAVSACRARQNDEDYLWADVYNAAHHNHMLAYRAR